MAGLFGIWAKAWRDTHRLRLPMLLLAAGLAVNVVLYMSDLRSSQARASEVLQDGGSAVIGIVEEMAQNGLVQVSAMKGLFEASEVVTAQEFHEFAHIVGGSPVSLLGFAPIVPADELVDYLAMARVTEPSLTIFERNGSVRHPVSPRPRFLPVHFAVSFSALDADQGFDLASDPDRAPAIDMALKTGQPAMTGLVELPGDDTPGDVELFLSVGDQDGEPTGLVFAVLQLDEQLSNRAPTTLPNGVTWSLVELEAGDNSFQPVLRSDLWRGTFELLDGSWGLELRASTELLQNELEGHLAGLIMGVVAALLAALALHFFLQQIGSREEVNRLRDITKQKDRFIAGVSHELRTPITSIKGFLDVLADNRQTLADSETDEYLELARQEAQELADLVEDLLTAGRLSAGALAVVPAPVDLNVQVRRVIDRISTPAKIQLLVGQELGSVWADPLRLRQILRNLFTNAVRYGERSVGVSSAISGREVRLEVRNDGPPIPIPMRERIFEPFQTAGSRPTQPDSIGLGLSISRQLARAMGGDLTYRYTSGHSVFTVTLPASRIALAERGARAVEPSHI